MPDSILLKRCFVRLLFYCLLLVGGIGVGWAQVPKAFSPSAVEPGVVHLKVSESFAAQLELSKMGRTSSNVVQTGMQTLDRVHRQFNARSMKRVFPYAGKLEAKHRKHGLHLWYEVRVDQVISLQSALKAYEELEQVTLAEPVAQKKLIDPGRITLKPMQLGKSETSLVRDTLNPFNDPGLKRQWHYNNSGQTKGTVGADIQLFDAWKVETGKKNVIVAVIDGGIDEAHPDLEANLWINTKEIAGNGKDDDRNGYVDDVHGYSFVDDQSTITPHFHGTHVAGTIAATNNNGIGVSGIAGGSGKGDGVSLMSCAVFKGTEQESTGGGFEIGFVYGADNGAVIAQNSWGNRYEDIPLEQIMIDAIDYFIAEAGTDEKGNQTGPMKGGIVIFAAGNDNDDGFWGPGNLPQTLSVASTTHKDTKSWYSNFGDWVDIAAPGGETDIAAEGVLSTYPGGKYAFFQGTSMACPHVSGVAALVVSQFGTTGFTPEMLRQRLVKGTDNIDAVNPEYVNLLGSGRLNAWKALQTGDEKAPEAITDLAVSKIGVSTLTLSWTSPDSTASAYDIRYSTSPITEENFAQATPAPWKGEVVPKPAGSKESFVVKGLKPETTYYLAIKTVDYLGNESELSNALTATTYLPPVAVVTPASLTVRLVTAQTTSEWIWIANDGKGPLEFELVSSDSLTFASISPTSGTVVAGDSAQVKVTLDAGNLLTGTYEATLQLATNDPKKEIILIPLTLEVTSNGAPIAQVAPDKLDFGGVILGDSLTKTITVSNAGSEALQIYQISSDAKAFTVAGSDSITVAAFKETILSITYTPADLSTIKGTLVLKTNDPTHSVLEVALVGEGIPAPGIAVSPDSVYASLKSNEKKTEQLRIRNTGGSDLTYAIQPSAAPKGTPSVKKITLDYGALSASRKGERNSGANATLLQVPTHPKKSLTHSVTLKSMGSSVIPLKVAILSPDPDVRDFEQILDGFDDVEADVFPLESLPTITAAALASYQVVIITNNYQWQLSGGVSAEKVGDVLADYVDAGGKVITSGATYLVIDAFKLKGRFIKENYGAFTETQSLYYDHVMLGKKLAPGHPVLEGVDTLFFEGYIPPVKPAPGAMALAEWKSEEFPDSYLLAAANVNCVSINLFPTFGTPSVPIEEIWEGDVPTLYHNAIRWLVPAPYATITPATGIVAPGEEKLVDVELDATGLNTGHYEAALAISTNIPGQKPVSVPLTLDVSGPEFSIAPDSLSLVLAKKEKTSRKLVLKNNGTGTYAYTITNQNTRLTEGPLSTSAVQIETVPASTNGKTFSLDELQARYRLPSQVAAVSEATPSFYKTDFENFASGNINRQQSWVVAGEANTSGWNIDTTGSFATSGKKFVHRASDPAGWSNLYSPVVKPGQAAKSTVRMNLNFEGQGALWQIVFRTTNAFDAPITVMQLNLDGSLSMAIREGSQYKFVPMNENKPVDTFAFALELDRATHLFTVYFNDRKVFSGRSMEDADIELVVFGSGTESGKTHLSMDDFEIREGAKEEVPAYLSFSPQSGTLAPGEQTEIEVEIDATKLGFGTYHSDLVVDVAGSQKLVVPTSVTLTGASAITLNRTLLKNTVEYKNSIESHFEISNTGGSPLTYQLDVLGGTVKIDTTSKRSARVASTEESRQREQKQQLDAQLSKALDALTAKSVQVLTGKSVLKESFEGTFPPKGWSSQGWNTAKAAREGNYAGSGEAATLVADNKNRDRELLSPVMSVKNKKLTLQYQANYQNYANQDFLDLDIRVNGESTWQNVLHWNEDHGSLQGNGELVKVELEKYLQKAQSFQVRWHYQATQADGWYTQLDNVEVLEDAKPWLTVSPVSGTLPARGTADITATFDAAYLEAGDFLGGIVVNSDAANASQVGIVASLHVLKPAKLAVIPDSVYIEGYQGYLIADTITVINTGESTWSYSFSNNEGWVGSLSLPINSLDEVEPDSSKQILLEFNPYLQPGLYHDTLYIHSDLPYYPTLKVPLTFRLHRSPRIEVSADTIRQEVKEGQMLAAQFNIINVGGDSLQFALGGSTKWLKYTPQSGSIGADSSMAVTLNFDATQVGTGVYKTTLTVYHNDPFLAPIEVPVVMTVLSSPARIQIAPEIIAQTVSVGEVATASFAISNVGGTPLGFNVINIKNIPWLSFSEGTGTIWPDSSQMVKLTFDATALEAGIYQDTLFIGNSDPQNGLFPVPITLTVLEVAEGVQQLSLVNVRTGKEFYELGDSLLLDVAHPDFVSFGIAAAVSKGVDKVVFTLDGEVANTASKAPYLLDALTLVQLEKGTYQLWAQAYTGGSASGKAKSVVITVFNSALVSGITVVNPLGKGLQGLHKGDTLDISKESYTKINLKAKVSGKGVGSVKFYLNGEHFTTDNNAPYSLAGDLLGQYFLPWKVKPGHYVLKATPYSLPYGAGVVGSSFTVEFDVVDGMQTGGAQAGGSQAGPVAELALYPVPATTELTLSVKGAMLVGQAQVVIRNAQGQVLYQQSVGAKALTSHKVNLGALPAGVYHLQILGEDGVIQSKTFVKQ